MVRKRAHKIEESEESSDSDYGRDVLSEEEPQPKKYSLRQRKRAMFTEDFEYDMEQDGDNQFESLGEKRDSGDEDFEVPALDSVEPGCTVTSYKQIDFEPELCESQNADGLIDFEDVIRADILVNKNRIDYDNIIEKTEIKVEPPPKKRGRKPKKGLELQTEIDSDSTSEKALGEISENIFEPETNVTEDLISTPDISSELLETICDEAKPLEIAIEKPNLTNVPNSTNEADISQVCENSRNNLKDPQEDSSSNILEERTSAVILETNC